MKKSLLALSVVNTVLAAVVTVALVFALRGAVGGTAGVSAADTG